MKRRLKALIAVRSGSLRVKNKNLRPFCGSSLLELRLKQLTQIPEIEQVCVSSNDHTMLQLASDLGAYPLLRDSFYASNTVSMSEVYSYMANQVDCDDILFTTVTTPLVMTSSYRKAIAIFQNLDPNKFDSLTTVSSVKEFLYLGNKAVNYDPHNVPRSQDLPDIYKLTFAISILPRQMMLSRGNCVGASPFFMELDQVESLDIDTTVDFFCAESLYNYLVIQERKLEDSF